MAPGEKVCITGIGASGKTTLVNLLMGMYEPDAGFVAYNGVTYGNIDPISLRGYIGACLSQKYLFRGTIRENLDMGFEHVTLDKVLYALELVGLTRYVQSLPKGLDTEIVPESIQIPQTISRKLIVARCLVIEPRLLVLDESFGTWDRPDQEHMLSLLTETLPATVIAISNDRSYAAKCHKIIIMEQGEIKEIGSYEEIADRPYFNDCFFG
ncbi:MAG: ATP-binding cassette domain-containing protein [Bacteroidota bacterium]